jgi:hypothetical protein
MKRHTSENRKIEVACFLETKRKKENAVTILPLVYPNRGASQVA